MVVNTSNWESTSFSLPQYATATTVQPALAQVGSPDVEPRLTQPCNPEVPIFFTTPDAKQFKEPSDEDNF